LNSNKLFFKKNEKKYSEQKKTGVLTCLLGLLTISRAYAQSTTATGLMAVSTMILAGSPATLNNGETGSCSVSAGDLNFAAYTGSLITATSTVSINCSNNTNYSISFNDTPEATPAYYLVRVGGTSATASDRLNVIFTNTEGATMTKGAATISGIGIGSSAVAGTITGTLAKDQTGKTAGSYSKIMTLNVVYNSNPPIN
jgi:spore coat protein U-like protein